VLLPALLLVLLVFRGTFRKHKTEGGVPPEQALGTFELAPGFQIELVAHEPLVADPVAMEIDENGRFYVVEMHGYPLDKSGSGKIKLLSDTNGDGKMDKSTVFAEGLMLPTGIMRWKKGVLVTDAPHLLYLEDTDGDGTADRRDTLLTGFALSNPQHNVNSPLLGLDNWIYLGHEQAVTANVFKAEFGDRGGTVRYPHRPDAPQLPDNARGRSVRLRPDRGGLEALSSYTQFGHSFDRWGRYLLVTNANHIFQEVLPDRYLRRNPDLLVSNTTQVLSDHGAAAEVFPVTANPEHQLLTDVGVFTSACGITAYNDGLFPAAFAHAAFVAEPVSNLVHVDVLKKNGASFTASRMYPNREFLASTDAWFRPVNMYLGPDGALYVLDYYRQIIEHPEWMAEEVTRSGALYNGTTQGRIYRITPKGTPPLALAKAAEVGKANTRQLVSYLSHANSWWRRQAQRLLIDQNDPKAAPLLEQQLRQGTSAPGRLHALWTLEGLGRLRPGQLLTALRDPEPGVRENAIRLTEQFLATSPELAAALLNLAGEPEARVRYQLLLTLGSQESPAAARLREQLLFQDLTDPWVQLAALTAPTAQQTGLLQAVLARFDPAQPAYLSLVERLGTLAGAAAEPAALAQLIGQAVQPDPTLPWQPPLLSGLAEGLRNRKRVPTALEASQQRVLDATGEHPVAAVREAGIRLLRVLGLPEGTAAAALQRAERRALDSTQPADGRAEALRLLALRPSMSYAQTLGPLLAPAEPLPVQLAAIQTLSSLPDATATTLLLGQWKRLTPDLRDAALNTFLTREDRIGLLLDALEQHQVDASSLGWRRSVRLMSHPNERLRTRARTLLAPPPGQAEAVVQAYQPALTLAADAGRGQLVFQKNCALCHQINEQQGQPFGPDLATLRNRPPASILADILNPNRSIADGFDSWEITLKNGEVLQAVIAEETPTALTLRYPGGQQSTIARSRIGQLQALPVSAMPAGLEQQVSQQEMADLLAFIRQRK
jgi:putative membrane-bound dehydrogenase-like protein